MLKYSGRTTLHCHKFKDWKDKPLPENPNPGLKKVWMLDAQWSTCPVEVESQIQDLWRFNELGNDDYIMKTCIKRLQHIGDPSSNNLVERWSDEPMGWFKGPLKTDLIVQYLKEHNLDDEDLVIIHWWW